MSIKQYEVMELKKKLKTGKTKEEERRNKQMLQMIEKTIALKGNERLTAEVGQIKIDEIQEIHIMWLIGKMALEEHLTETQKEERKKTMDQTVTGKTNQTRLTQIRLKNLFGGECFSREYYDLLRSAIKEVHQEYVQEIQGEYAEGDGQKSTKKGVEQP